MFGTIEAIVFLLILIPGFVASNIFELLTKRGKRGSTIEIIIRGLLWSLIVWIPYMITARIFDILINPINLLEKNLNSYCFKQYLISITFILSTSIIISVVQSAISNRGIPFKLLKRLRITKLTGDPNIWVTVFRYEGRWIRVFLKNGYKYIGWPAIYPQGDEKDMIVLKNVVVYPPEKEKYNVAQVILNDLSEIEFIEVLKE